MTIPAWWGWPSKNNNKHNLYSAGLSPILVYRYKLVSHPARKTASTLIKIKPFSGLHLEYLHKVIDRNNTRLPRTNLCSKYDSIASPTKHTICDIELEQLSSSHKHHSVTSCELYTSCCKEGKQLWTSRWVCKLSPPNGGACDLSNSVRKCSWRHLLTVCLADWESNWDLI